MAIRIVTDSTCDLPADTVERLGIHVIPLYIHMAGQSYLDGVDISREGFYERLPGLAAQPTTAAPGSERFARIYDTLTEEGAEHILSIHIAQSLSATLNFAHTGAADARIADVTVYDSGQLSLGVGYIVQRAAELARDGHTMEHIVAALQELGHRTHVFAALDTLEFLKRSGRMSWALSVVGEMVRLRPILHMHDGISTVERIRTDKRALARVGELLSELLPVERLTLVHTNARQRADDLMHLVRAIVPHLELERVNITPAIGAHIGPNAVGLALVSAGRR